MKNRDRQHRSVSSQSNLECQEGDPLGASYSGEKNVTLSGTTCQFWAASEPHQHTFTDVGEHNYCRNPDGDPDGVWCYTIDPDKEYEYCDVRRCGATYNCQEGNPLGASYLGDRNVTASGRPCQAWTAEEPHDSLHWEMGDHNLCRNPDEDPNWVWCYTTDPDKQWEYCDVKRCDVTYNTTSSQGNQKCQEGDSLCEPTMLKVLDFSADNDNDLDSKGEYTGATLKPGPLPESFTICSAFMVDAWTPEFTSAYMFILNDDNGTRWGYIKLYAAPSYTVYEVELGTLFFMNKTKAVFFPLQWSLGRYDF